MKNVNLTAIALAVTLLFTSSVNARLQSAGDQ